MDRAPRWRPPAGETGTSASPPPASASGGIALFSEHAVLQINQPLDAHAWQVGPGQLAIGKAWHRCLLIPDQPEAALRDPIGEVNRIITVSVIAL